MSYIILIKKNQTFQQINIKVNTGSADLNTPAPDTISFKRQDKLGGFSFYIPQQFNNSVNMRIKVDQYKVYRSSGHIYCVNQIRFSLIPLIVLYNTVYSN